MIIWDKVLGYWTNGNTDSIGGAVCEWAGLINMFLVGKRGVENCAHSETIAIRDAWAEHFLPKRLATYALGHFKKKPPGDRPGGCRSPSILAGWGRYMMPNVARTEAQAFSGNRLLFA